MKVIVLLGLMAAAMAQDSDSNANVRTAVSWPQNKDTNAGFLANFAYADIGDGCCTFVLPAAARLFHVMNGHIVPGDGTSPIEGRYKVAAPAGWEMANGTLSVLVYCARDDIFNATDIGFTCDTEDVAEISVYSFPQNDETVEASSNIYYRPGFKSVDILSISLPAPVERFNITGGDSRWDVVYEGDTITVSGFVNEAGQPGSDQQKEVHFSLTYLRGDTEENSEVNWFSAGQIAVSVDQVEDEE